MDTDVLVVGAGPTGLVAAAELARRGVRVRMIEKTLERSPRSRALVLQPRSLEVLQRMGALEELLDLGQRSLTIHVHVHARCVAEVAVPDIGFDDTPFPYQLFVSQAETERVLEGHAARLGVQVERGLALVALRERADLVEADLAGGRGSETVRARYVVGADGAHSTVRTLAGLRFRGDAYPQSFALADVDVTWAYPPGGVHLFFWRRGVFVFLPMRGESAYRIVMARGREAGQGDPTLEEVRARAREATGLQLGIENPRWLARFHLHHRGVDAYRRGRIFVAGDAAHIHSPAGGQGMNTGIQDAFNLGWKLALVLTGRGAEPLLDSYHAERHPVGRNLLRFTDRLFRVGASDSWLVAQLRRLAVPRAAPFVLKERRRRARAFRFVSQLGIRYDESPIVEEPRRRGSLGSTPRAGWRAPDAAFAGTTLFSQMTGDGFHLLCFGASGQDRLAVEAALRGTRGLVTPIYVERGGEASRRYGVNEAACILVRPDGYIATRSPDADPAPVAGYLARQGFVAPPAD